MATEVIMPKVDMDMSHGRVLAWRVKEGQTVEKGEPLFDIETDKAAMEVESPASGTVRDLVEENVDVAIGEPVAFIYADGESITLPAGAPASAAIKAQPDPYATTDQPAGSITETDVTIPSGGPGRNGAAVDECPHSKLRASPVARRIARDKGINLARISGSGPRGRILRKDVESWIAASTASPAASLGESPTQRGDGQLVANSPMRKVIAKRLQESKRTAPHFYMTMDCHADDLLASRLKIHQAMPEGKKVSVNDMIVMAAAKALHAVPEVNASWHDEHIELFPSANIAIAVAIEGGLVTPVIHHADSLSLSEISDRSAALAQSARAGKLGRDDLANGTFTISNLGMYGIREFAAVINPPQGAILAVGACEKRPVVNGDTLDIATMMTVTLSCDHRVVDGAVGARWLQAFKGLVENPMAMLL